MSDDKRQKNGLEEVSNGQEEAEKQKDVPEEALALDGDSVSGIELDGKAAEGEDCANEETSVSQAIKDELNKDASPEKDEELELDADAAEDAEVELDADAAEDAGLELDADAAEDTEPELDVDAAEDTEPELDAEDGELFEDDPEEDPMTEEEKAERRKKRKKILLITLGSIFGTVAAVYLGFAIFFMSHFQFYTEINGVTFSCKNVEAVESYMELQVKDYTLFMQESDGGVEKIAGSDIDLSYQKGDELKALLKKQNPFLWPQSLWKTPVITASVGVDYDESKLEQIIAGLACMKEENQTDPVSAQPEFDGNSFVVKTEEVGSRIDTEVFGEKIKEYLDGFKDTLDLTEESCYVKPKYLSDSPEVAAACEAMNQYLNASITYTFSSATEVVDKALISQWLTVDDNMAVTFNTDAVSQYIQSLADKYNTYKVQRSFTSGNGNTVSVEGGDYGWIIDQDAEYAALVASIQNSEVITKEPAYSQTGATHDGADWGSTYVEIDLTNQYMYLFVNGAVVTQSDIVTGKPSAGDATPQGVYYIKYCTTNAVLRGPKKADGSYEWESPVSYWMPFNGGIGLHDAPWQAAYGGSRYLTHGSHGCVNLPYSVAQSVYNNVQAGTPVVCHY